MHVFAEIITIGDELLIGQIVDTNSAFIADELTKIGISVRRIISIPDKSHDIIETLENSLKYANILILTGGLGPTSDDITKQTLAQLFDSKMIIHKPTLREIEKYFAKRGIEVSERNRKQAEIPNVCTPLKNSIGTAPGMLFMKSGRQIYSLPGVPFEMKALIKEQVIPTILKEFKLPIILHTTVLTTGLSESYAADLLKEWEERIPAGCSLAYLPSPGILKLRISISGSNREILKNQLKSLEEELKSLIGYQFVFGTDTDTLQSVIGRRLTELHQTLAVAESCTGGYIAHLVTSVPGASAYFYGSATSYSNNSKIKVLKVSESNIQSEGSVSKAVVEQMAEGAKRIFNTDFGIATSGIAGPDGGTELKPVGTIWIAVATPDKIITQKFFFPDVRERNIVRASITALNMLRIAIDEFNKK
jgi:nicotinamide-nucleotide amidase